MRIYNPNPKEELSIFIYYHRGGWVFSNIEVSDLEFFIVVQLEMFGS
jgi:acetyl esterase/lipase